MTKKILLVDDDRIILTVYQRALRDILELDVAQGGAEALQMLDHSGPYAVVVADMQMPGMNGLQLLAEVQARCPDMVRIMLTANTDQQTAADAVNQGQVFRFLSKPCPPEDLALAVRAGVRQFQLVSAERELLEGTLTGAIEVLAGLLASVDPSAFSLGLLVRSRCGEVARRMGCSDVWAIEVGAMLAPIGKIALPQKIINADHSRPQAQAILAGFPEIGASLIQAIPRMELVAEIIRYQAKGFDGSGPPAPGPEGIDIPIGARILRAVRDFTTLETSRQSQAVALEELRLHALPYDPVVLDALQACFGSATEPPPTPCLVPLCALAPGMILTADLLTSSGQLILARGLRLGAGHIKLLQNLQKLLEITDPIPVLQS